MLRTCTRIIALAAMVAGPTAQAADTTLALACQGTVTVYEHPRTTTSGDAKPEPFSMGITINLTAGTVQGFGMEYPVKITNINAGTIIFSHSDKQ